MLVMLMSEVKSWLVLSNKSKYNLCLVRCIVYSVAVAATAVTV